MKQFKVTVLDDARTRVPATVKRWDTWIAALAYAGTVARSRYPVIEPRPVTQPDTDVDLGGGYSARVTCEPDTDSGPPWEQADGHGPVSDWRPYSRGYNDHPKAPGELVLCVDSHRARFYDFREAVKIARRDKWGSPGAEGLTPGAKAARAAMHDYEFLRAWCNDEWRYIGVCVAVSYRGTPCGDEALWGVEDQGDYWQESAAEMIEGLVTAHQTRRNQAAARARIEARERAYWAARDVVTR